ncbi:hypothetical protein Hanom_Chr09g00797391 [Helianthus anomalus]
MFENELLKMMVNDHEEDKKLKSKKMEMLYVVSENKMDKSVQAEYDQIEIQIVEARRVEREKKAAEEAVEVEKYRGKKKIVAYSDDDDDEYEDEKEDDEFDDLSDSANYPKDDKDDDDDDDAQGGGGNLQIVK